MEPESYPHSSEHFSFDSQAFLNFRRQVRQGSQDAYEKLVRIIRQGNYSPRRQIFELFMEIEDPAIVLIITSQLVRSGEGPGTIHLIEKLGEFDIPDVQHPLILLLKNPDEDIRLASIKALGMLSDPRLLEAIVAALEDVSEHVRTEAMQILSSEKEPEAVEHLVRALQDRRFFIVYRRRLAAKLLGMFKDPRAIPALIESLEDPQEETKIHAIRSLTNFKKPEVEAALEQLLDKKDQAIALEAAMALHVFNNPKTIAFLTDALSDKSGSNRLDIIPILGKFNDPEVIPLLTRQMMSSSMQVRYAARKALHNLRELHDLSPLLEILDMWDSHVLSPHVQYLTSLYMKDDKDRALIMAGIFYGRNPHWEAFLTELDAFPEENEWSHLRFFARVNLADTRLGPMQITRLKWLLGKHTNQLKKDRKELLCKNHLSRFTRVQGQHLAYYACRTCKKTDHLLKAETVVAVLDQTMQEMTATYGYTLRINWLKFREIFDFDLVEIGECAEDDITTFCIDMGNDSDPFRAKNHKKLACRIQKGIKLSTATLRRLQVSFNTVSFLSSPVGVD